MAEAVRLQDAVARYLARQQKTTAKTTYANTRSVVLRFQAHIGGNPYMRAIGADQVFDFFYGDYKTSLNPALRESSFNEARARVRRFLEYCEHRGWVGSLLLDDVRVKDEPEQNRRRFTATEMTRLCGSVAQPQERILVALACNTALRITDITLLPVRAVDLAGGWLHVSIHKTHRQDDLPITRELDAALREWFIHYAETLGRPLEPDMLLVPAKHNAGWGAVADRPIQYSPYSQITKPDSKYRRIVDAAGLPRDSGDGFHTLRRSFARIFYEELKVQGHPDPIRPVQAMLHHAKPEMTYRYIGVQLDRAARNEVLRGRAFLSRLAADTTNVTQLHTVRGPV